MKKIIDNYNAWAYQYDNNINPTRDLDKTVTKESLSNIDFFKVLELGCGSGKNTEWLITKADKLVGLDFSKNMLDLARQSNARFIFFSSSEIYGDPEIHPQSEEYWGNVNPIGVRSCYVEGKRCVESIIYDYVKHDTLSASIIRLFNTYGPYMSSNDGRVMSNFIVNALQNDDMIIYGNGTQTRSFCYISDLLNFFDKMISSKLLGPINAGSPNEVSVLDLAKIIIEKTNSRSNIIYKDLPGDDPARRKPCINYAKNEINRVPSVSLDKGVDLVIEYFKSILI